MKKMKLVLDRLAVESFVTAHAGGQARGTVAGHGIVVAPPTLPQCRPSDFCPEVTKEFNQCHTWVDEWCRCDDSKALCHSDVAICMVDSANCTVADTGVAIG